MTNSLSIEGGGSPSPAACGRRSRLSRRPLRLAAARPLALARAPAGPAVGRGPRDGFLRPELASRSRLRRHRPPFSPRRVGRLPLSERLDAGAPDDARRLPVMVWIHGGGFVVWLRLGAALRQTRLAAHGNVVVTLNHRLTRWASSRIRSSPPKRTIRFRKLRHARPRRGAPMGQPQHCRFRRRPEPGDDRRRIRGLRGASGADGLALAKGLFARAIGESGAMFASPSPRAGTRSRRPRPPVSLSCARSARIRWLNCAPAEAILEAAPGLGFRPIVDGSFLPKLAGRDFRFRRAVRCPADGGMDKDEGFDSTSRGTTRRTGFPVSRARFSARAPTRRLSLSRRVARTDKASARALGGDLTMIHSTWAWTEAQKAHGHSDVFRFRFDRCPLTPQGWFGGRRRRDAGAFHAGENPYVFDNLDVFPWTVKEAIGISRNWRRATGSIWSGPAIHGGGLPRWASFRGAGAPVMMLDTPPKAGPEEWRERQAFLSWATEAGSR